MALFILFAIAINMAAATRGPHDCYFKESPNGFEKDGENGRSYRGLTDITVSGRVCAKWATAVNNVDASKTAWRPKLAPVADSEDEKGVMHWGNGIGNHNYCRNPKPDAAHPAPWCFTQQGKEEACNIPVCEPHVSFQKQATALGKKMKATSCDCAGQLYGKSAFLEEAHEGQTRDGRPCRC